MTLLDPDVSTLEAALARAEAGETIAADEAEALLSATGAQLDRLLDAAARVRDAGLEGIGRPRVMTYSRKVFIPLTTLCRDRCHYCIFVDTPGQLLKQHKPEYMSRAQVLAVARQGQALGCKEALLTLGDRPEDRWPEARAWLDRHGYASTLEYVADMARAITAETGLLPHLNPGIMTPEELEMLRPVAPSMGVMLETTSRRLYEEPGQVHYGSPDKDPDVRLRLLDDAGTARIPFTTGILVGIGETLRDRAESLIALRDAHARHGHLQEVIVQNFRAKPRTAMQDQPDADLLEYVAAVAVARLVMGPGMRIQVPPNLSDPQEFALLVRAGADDWGGVSPLTADHVNPERPWPHLDDLAAATADAGFALRERLTAHPPYVDDAWLDPEIRDVTYALADPVSGLARTGAAGVVLRPEGASATDPAGSGHDERRRAADTGGETTRARPSRGGIARLLDEAAAAPGSIDDAGWEALLRAEGRDLDRLAATADDVRRYTVGEALSIVANRNVASTAFRRRPTGEPDTYDLDGLAEIARDADDLRLTEICVQGLVAPGQDAESYLDIARTISHAAPGIHLHAFRPQDVADLADRSGLGLDGALRAMREAGVDTVPGTGVKVLSERVRELIAPGDLPIERWREGVSAAHRAGFRSTSVMFYGHAETAAERVAHLRELAAIQRAAADSGSGGGFTEFVPIPLPEPLGGGTPLVASRAPLDEHRAMVAVSRLFLSGTIPHIQIPWTRHGVPASIELLQAGGDDLGGTLMDGRVLPGAGVEQGLQLPLEAARDIARGLFRPFRQRSTTYGDVSIVRETPSARAARQASRKARG
ncbi:7,8-didemethyl-8-hydroxy-5-deazariboflavin synthase CofG [Microbacterium marinilacus]|uniref:7,8-didemethyl-8-hydroxy-5-deazariboflavin synthase n=1 Tax=Microbacterium marinilacus TaxID=415209 RepID=A0ABP7BMZ0_9MICO|nr:7,8-didemethyl-8-hydroxy-5-deazariboflavin synthase CofG [Microbacterium marinilacus]MBY0689686.1 7,8-didemethyl-8-hydroxy-5-deazariboflavin synthase CofG [Microbacterium marinilacus]